MPSADGRIDAQAPAELVATPLTRRKISEERSKQLLQAMQAVLHDPCFGNLSSATIEGVHRALTGLEGLLDLPGKAHQKSRK